MSSPLSSSHVHLNTKWNICLFFPLKAKRDKNVLLLQNVSQSKISLSAPGDLTGKKGAKHVSQHP